jgi:aldehyde:ferredoxin oxidoreductase
VPDVELMLREYYEARDWDLATGRPSREKLLSLDLEAMAGDLWGPKT